MKSSISIIEKNVGAVRVLHVAGSLDGHTCGDLERIINKVLASGIDRLIIELNELAYIASAGVGFLVNIQNRLKKTGGNLHLVHPKDSVREIIGVLGLESVFLIHDNLQQAVAATGIQR